MSTPSFVVFSTPQDTETLTALRLLLIGDETDPAMQAVSTLEEGIAFSADVLILYLADDALPALTDDLTQSLKERKVIGIGYFAAQLFGMLGLEINDGACAHYGTVAPKIRVEQSKLLPEFQIKDSMRVVQLSPKAMNLDHFGMHIPKHSPLLSFVDVIARDAEDENYALIVRQGNFVLIGLVAPAEIWTLEYRDLFRNVAFALREREAEQFSRAQWDLIQPGTYNFALIEGFSTKAASSRTFYFRFSKPTTLTATLRHKGSNNMMLLFMGDKNREHWTRANAKEGEVLEININITEEDIKNIGDWYWFLRVTNFDPEHTAECSLRIEYQE